MKTFLSCHRVILMSATCILVALICGQSGCSKALEQVAGFVVQHQLDSIEDFQGLMTQRTIITPKDLTIVSRVRYKNSGIFSSEVISPPEYAGFAIDYNGHSFTVYRPWEKTAQRVIGMTPLTNSDRQERIKQATSELTESFSFEHSGSSLIAKRETIQISVLPKPDNERKLRGTLQLDKEWSLPLEIDILDPQGYTLYHNQYRHIVFNQGISEDLFLNTLPADTTIHEWDFSKEPLTLEEIEPIIGTSLELPNVSHLSCSLKGFYLSDTNPPAILADFGNDSIVLQYLQTPLAESTEKRTLLPLYIPLYTKNFIARYSPMVGLKFVSWDKKNVENTIISNLTLTEITNIIDSMD